MGAQKCGRNCGYGGKRQSWELGAPHVPARDFYSGQGAQRSAPKRKSSQADISLGGSKTVLSMAAAALPSGRLRSRCCQIYILSFSKTEKTKWT